MENGNYLYTNIHQTVVTIEHIVLRLEHMRLNLIQLSINENKFIITDIAIAI